MGIAEQFRDKAQRLAEQAKSRKGDKDSSGDMDKDMKSAAGERGSQPQESMGEGRQAAGSEARGARDDYDDSYEA